MELRDLATELSSNAYPGRGIVIGKSSDGKYAVSAYFIMGRSVNSRNRVFEEKNGARSEQERAALAEGLDRIMEAFAVCMKNGEAADSAEAQALVRRLQNYITEHFYTCTEQILLGLGQTYVSDERFRQNIDKHGAGAAAFIRNAIEAFCRK